MDPSSLSCPTLACPDKGLPGAGNVRIQSRAEARYRCRTCTRTFAATTNTPLYRLHHPAATLTLVRTLLLHGCPSAAIVAAVGVDERTVRAWLHKAGAHAGKRQDSERHWAVAHGNKRWPLPDVAYAARRTAHTTPQRSWNRRRCSAKDTVSFMCWR